MNKLDTPEANEFKLKMLLMGLDISSRDQSTLHWHTGNTHVFLNARETVDLFVNIVTKGAHFYVPNTWIKGLTLSEAIEKLTERLDVT